MVVREGFRKMLELENDFDIVGEAQDGRQAVALAKKFRPDVVLMDIAMPLLNGLEATRQIYKDLPGTKVLMLSAHSDDAYVAKATEFGAVGFLLKQTSAHVVCEAIRQVQKGKKYFCSIISRRQDRIHPLSPDRAVSWMSSFCMTCSRCFSTVLMPMPSSFAVSLLALPSAMSWSTSISREVNGAAFLVNLLAAVG